MDLITGSTAFSWTTLARLSSLYGGSGSSIGQGSGPGADALLGGAHDRPVEKIRGSLLGTRSRFAAAPRAGDPKTMRAGELTGSPSR